MRNEYIIVRGTCQSPTRFISPALNPRSHLSEAGDGERESFRPLPDAAPPPAGGWEREAEREFASPFPPAGLGEREREAERAGGGAARPLLARPPLSRSRDDFVSISRRPSRDERRSSRLEAQRKKRSQEKAFKLKRRRHTCATCDRENDCGYASGVSRGAHENANANVSDCAYSTHTSGIIKRIGTPVRSDSTPVQATRRRATERPSTKKYKLNVQ